MAREDLVLIEGKVIEVAAGGNFMVEGPNGMRIAAKLAGKLRRKHIRVILGDHVTVGVSPYDPSHGLITYRGKDPALSRS
ncbi:MAG TPA: translation initiation factor IF-1 [Oligoflexia bacterium]|nr:translation initiation factor IF-1 [Oligoflexia bacterium]HMR25788.1 translation initiation factor IF-1 [Oligoflexia bacterium]